MSIEKRIKDSLSQLETERNINILLAIESGSRAWGFPSQDSDFDVRIIYSHPKEHYLSVFDQKDTLEVPITDELDIAGWDLGKSLKLMYAGNAVVHEWLNSPIIYRQNTSRVRQLREFSESAFNPVKAFHHYLAMSCKKFDLKLGENFTAKRLLYAYRTLLCAQWVAKHRSAPPMVFQDLMKALLEDQSAVFDDLLKIIADKEHQNEQQPIQVSKSLQDYSEESIKQLKRIVLEKFKRPPQRLFDQLFRTLLD